MAACLLLAQAALALEVDPRVRERAAPDGVLEGRLQVLLAAGGLTLAASLLLLRPRAWSAGAALALGALVLVLGTPLGSAPFHTVQAVCLLAATVSAALALAGAANPAPWLVRGLLVCVPLLLCEAACSTVARSHAVGYTLAARLWFARHWSPPGNSLGFRDVEHVEDGRRKLFVVGDSLVSGVGIADVRERLGEQLGTRLGPEWQIHNVAHNGADTLREQELLEAYPFQPDVIVLSYYVNDIAGAGERAGLVRPWYRPYRDLGRLAWLVSRSYLLDYLYWARPRDDLRTEQRFLEQCRTHAATLTLHRRELEQLVASARSRAPLVLAVVFPDLREPEASAAGLQPALEVLARAGVPVVDVRQLLVDLPVEARVVNRNDAHPSARVHARVAEGLERELRARLVD